MKSGPYNNATAVSIDVTLEEDLSKLVQKHDLVVRWDSEVYEGQEFFFTNLQFVSYIHSHLAILMVLYGGKFLGGSV